MRTLYDLLASLGILIIMFACFTVVMLFFTSLPKTRGGPRLSDRTTQDPNRGGKHHG